MNRLRMLAVALAVLTFGTSSTTCQTWQPLANQPSFSPGAVLLLTDGTVLAHSEPNCLNCTSTDYNSWYRLTPDSSGSYVHCTWTQVASPTGYAPLYFGSVVLPDGRVVVEGGEYDCSSGTCNAAWTNQGAIYDPVNNRWNFGRAAHRLENHRRCAICDSAQRNVYAGKLLHQRRSAI